MTSFKFGFSKDVHGTFVGSPYGDGPDASGASFGGDRPKFWERMTQPDAARNPSEETQDPAESRPADWIDSLPSGMRPGERPSPTQISRCMSDGEAAFTYRRTTVSEILEAARLDFGKRRKGYAPDAVAESAATEKNQT
jgi:hypothetical protein